MPGVQMDFPCLPPSLQTAVMRGLLSWLNPSCTWCLEREVRPGCWSKDHKSDVLTRTYPESGNCNSSLGLILISYLLDVKIMVGTKVRFNIWCLGTKSNRKTLFRITFDRRKNVFVLSIRKILDRRNKNLWSICRSKDVRAKKICGFAVVFLEPLL